MAHPEQLQFVRTVKNHLGGYFQGTRVLEVGSLDLNGSVRMFFEGCDYVGVDVAPGKGVDLVCQGQLLEFPTGHFDVVISCEAMEHNPYWVETTANMLRLCRPGGLVVMTCASQGRAEHGTSRTNPDDSPLTVKLRWDYYRNLSARDFQDTFPLNLWFGDWCFFQNWNSYDLLFVGIRAGDGSARLIKPLISEIERLIAPRHRRLVAVRKLLFSVLGDRGLFVLRNLSSRR